MNPTDPTTGPAEAIRVGRGSPTPEELAALTAVLLSRTAGDGAGPDDVSRHHRATARWRRPERTPRSAGARSWHEATRPATP